MLEYSRNCGSFVKCFGFRQLHEYSIGKNYHDTYRKCLTVTYKKNEIVVKSSNSNSDSLCSLRTIAKATIHYLSLLKLCVKEQVYTGLSNLR